MRSIITSRQFIIRVVYLSGTHVLQKTEEEEIKDANILITRQTRTNGVGELGSEQDIYPKFTELNKTKMGFSINAQLIILSS